MKPSELKNSATNSSKEALKLIGEDFQRIDFILIISAVSSIIISFILLYLISKHISKNLNEIIAKSEEIANGRLNIAELKYAGTDEIGKLSKSINGMGNSLRNMISEISVLSVETDRQSATLLESSEEVKAGSEQVALTIEEMAMRVKNISALFTNVQQSSQKTNESVEYIAAISEESAAGFEEISAAVYEQSQSIDNISASAKMLTNMVERMNAMIKKFQL